MSQKPAVVLALRCRKLPEGASVVGFDEDGLRRLVPKMEISIGVDPECDVYVQGAVLGGRRNSRIVVTERGEVWLAHLGHSSPIYVNGKNVSSTRLLCPGDVMVHGQVEFEIIPTTITIASVTSSYSEPGWGAMTALAVSTALLDSSIDDRKHRLARIARVLGMEVLALCFAECEPEPPWSRIDLYRAAYRSAALTFHDSAGAESGYGKVYRALGRVLALAVRTPEEFHSLHPEFAESDFKRAEGFFQFYSRSYSGLSDPEFDRTREQAGVTGGCPPLAGLCSYPVLRQCLEMIIAPNVAGIVDLMREIELVRCQYTLASLRLDPPSHTADLILRFYPKTRQIDGTWREFLMFWRLGANAEFLADFVSEATDRSILT